MTTPPNLPETDGPPPSTIEWSSPAAAPGAGRPSRPSRLRVGIVGGAAIALVVGAVATSLAASPAPSGSTSGSGGSGPALIAPDLGPEGGMDGFDHGRFGGPGPRDVSITAISGNDVTLGTADGWRRTITITDAVDVTKGGQAAALADLKVGDQVAFRQTRDAAGTYTVTALAVVVPTIGGQISAPTSTGFKVTTRDGSVWTVTVNASTRFQFGTGDGTLTDVKAGESAVVAGTTTGDNALTALTVRVSPDRAIGTVTAKTADTITIKQRDGSSLAIHVGAATTYRVGGAAGTADSLADVSVDMAVAVTGRARADGSIDADQVVAGVGRGMMRDGFGGLDGPGFGGFPGRGGFRGFGDGGDDGSPDAAPSTAPTSAS
ncbi:MAG TPA: DUF5666 domain-containing protein [Candidatus Limnocylindrales bacterium]|nr:DUF5666 domain-containing protein [Candidatus Limnocylindrales bacterium]